MEEEEELTVFAEEVSDASLAWYLNHTGVSQPEQTRNFLRRIELVQSNRVRQRYRFSSDTNSWEKQCPGCKEFWPADPEFYHVALSSTDGLYYYCIACALEKKREYEHRRNWKSRISSIGVG